MNFKKSMLALLVVSIPASCGSFAKADDAIFAAADLPAGALPTVATSLTAIASSMNGLADAPTIQQHPDEVLAAAQTKVDKMAADGMITEQEKILIKGW